MSKNEGNIPAYFTSPNERGESQTAHTYCADKEIKPSFIVMRQDVYEHLSPLARKGADFLIQEKQLKVISGLEEGAA